MTRGKLASKYHASADAVDAITWAVEHDIIRDKSEGLLTQKSNATCGGAAAMLMCYLEERSATDRLI